MTPGQGEVGWIVQRVTLRLEAKCRMPRSENCATVLFPDPTAVNEKGKPPSRKARHCPGQRGDELVYWEVWKFQGQAQRLQTDTFSLDAKQHFAKYSGKCSGQVTQTGEMRFVRSPFNPNAPQPNQARHTVQVLDPAVAIPRDPKTFADLTLPPIGTVVDPRTKREFARLWDYPRGVAHVEGAMDLPTTCEEPPWWNDEAIATKVFRQQVVHHFNCMDKETVAKKIKADTKPDTDNFYMRTEEVIAKG